MSVASTWPWERLASSNAPSHDILSTLLEPRPGERWLDVGTGSGGLALRLAGAGADVVGVDLAEDGLAHAREQASAAGVTAEFVVGDAQELPFEDASFDGVASAFGAIFAPDHDTAARELARVCRPGGKLGMTLMPADSRAAAMWRVLRRYGGAGGAHPADWSERVDELLGASFELEVELRESPLDTSQADTPWEEFVRSFAPVRELVERLDGESVAAMRTELRDVNERYRERAPSYVLVLGRRRA